MVLVIGATGFIGLYTVEKLVADGYQVIGTGRNEHLAGMVRERGAEYIPLDITDPAAFRKLPTKDVEGVILLAGLLPANVKLDSDDAGNAAYFAVNVIGTINVLEYCRKNGIRKVLSTTSYSDVAGAWKKGCAISETEPRNFHFTGDHAVYVVSKNAACDVMECYNQQYGMQCASFRLPPVYGVGPHSAIYVDGKYYKSGIQTFIEKAQKGETIELWGDPEITRDIVYVKDVARAFSMALKSDRVTGLYNMTSSTELTLRRQAETVIDLFSGRKRSAIVCRPEKKNNTPSFLFDMSKAKRDFGFAPEYVSFSDMMADYKKELESGRWNTLIRERAKK